MADKFYYFLYRTTNLVNGKYYKGLHATDNLFDGYLGSGTAFKQALQKYGRKSFKRQIILFLPDLESLKQAEKLYITEQDIISDKCYNIREGGASQPGCKGIKRDPFTQEHRANISKGQIERYLRRKESGEVTYKPVANRSRKKPLRDPGDSARHMGALNPMFGKSGAANATSKAVYCVELNRTFESAMLAAKELGLAFQNISKVCQGKRQTCGGYHWRFVDPTKDSRKKTAAQKEKPSWYIKFDPNVQGPHQMTGFSNVRSRPIVCVDTKEVFGSTAEAAKAKGLSRGTLCQYCHEQKPYGGYNWMFLEDYERMTLVQHNPEETSCNSPSAESSE